MLSAVVAQTTSGEDPGFDIFGLLLPLALAFLLFTMFRRQRKTQQEVKQMRTQMEPGTEVMTQFGLFGTIVSIDQENNKAVLEISPGNHATVHMQALTKVVLQEPAAAVVDNDLDSSGEPARTSTVDSSSGDAPFSDDLDRPVAGGSSVTGSSSSAEDSFRTYSADGNPSAHTDRDALDQQDPGAKRDN